ncbi:MAG: FKBP-type peptidyl-prolyl cis-trans isomerase [Leeuwenhoekiella sp.]
MYKFIYLLPFALAFTSCDDTKTTSSGDDVELKTFRDSISYALGSNTGSQFKQAMGDNPEELFDIDLYEAGMRKSIEDSVTFPEESMRSLMQRFQTKIQAMQQEKMTKEAEVNRKEGEDFLTENAKKDSIMTTESGLQYKIIEEGTGESPSGTDQVSVNYEGRLIDGTVFDSSYKRNAPATFGVNQVIPGWTEGLQLMKEGAKYQFYIPSELAYGERGSGAKIKPGSTLIFDVELLEIETEE